MFIASSQNSWRFIKGSSATAQRLVLKAGCAGWAWNRPGRAGREEKGASTPWGQNYLETLTALCKPVFLKLKANLSSSSNKSNPGLILLGGAPGVAPETAGKTHQVWDSSGLSQKTNRWLGMSTIEGLCSKKFPQEIRFVILVLGDWRQRIRSAGLPWL